MNRAPDVDNLQDSVPRAARAGLAAGASPAVIATGAGRRRLAVHR